MSELPPGFVLDDTPAAPAPTGLPDGFVLDGAAPTAEPQDTGLYALHWPTMPSLSSVFNGVMNGAQGAVGTAANATPMSVLRGVESGMQGSYDTLTKGSPEGPSLIKMGKEIGQGVGGMLELSDAASRGELDPFSQGAIERAARFAAVNPLTPVSAGSALARAGAAAAAPAVGTTERAAADLGIGLTAGQRTGDPVLLSTENAMFGGAKGETAQRVAQDAVARQRGEVADAKQALADVAGRGQADLERYQDAGQVALDAVQQQAAAAKQATRDRYDAAFAHEGYMDPRVFTGRRASSEPPPPVGTALPPPPGPADAYAAPISQRITDALLNNANPIIIAPETTPLAHRALSTLDKIDNLRLGSIGQPAAGDSVVGINLRGVDQARRQLQSHYNVAAPGTPDRAVLGRAIGEFDNQIQRAMEDGLFSGDEAALDALRSARASHASYVRTFKPQGAGDDVGRAMQAIVERNATPEQVANYLYGTAKTGATPTSVRLADRLKPLLGEDSPEWAAIRQGAFMKALGGADVGSMVAAKRIEDFLNGSGKSLATRLYSGDERSEMLKLANVLRAISAKPGTVNPSGSGNRLAALARQSFGAIMSGLGAQAGGIPGAIAGYVGGKGLEAAGGAMNAARARQLYSGQAPATIADRIAQAQRPVVTGGQRNLIPFAQQYLPAFADQ